MDAFKMIDDDAMKSKIIIIYLSNKIMGRANDIILKIWDGIDRKNHRDIWSIYQGSLYMEEEVSTDMEGGGLDDSIPY